MRIICYLLVLIFFSCSSSDSNILVVNSGEAQGSYYHIKYMSNNGLDYHSDIDSLLMEVDSSLSIYKRYSLVSRLNDAIPSSLVDVDASSFTKEHSVGGTVRAVSSIDDSSA